MTLQWEYDINMNNRNFIPVTIWVRQILWCDSIPTKYILLRKSKIWSQQREAILCRTFTWKLNIWCIMLQWCFTTPIETKFIFKCVNPHCNDEDICLSMLSFNGVLWSKILDKLQVQWHTKVLFIRHNNSWQELGIFLRWAVAQGSFWRPMERGSLV